MGKVLASGGGGGGTGSDECTASKAQVLAGHTAVTSDSGDEAVAGTMPNNGAINASLNCGGSKTIPAGYTSGGTITANSLASQTGGCTAEDKYVYKGKTYYKDGVKRTGSMTCSSVLSFSVAAYSTSQVVATWKNPASGPFSGVIICAKTGSYPTGINDNRKYTGVGSNKAASGTSSVTISGLTAGTTYYFRIWAYTTCSAGDFYSGYLQATAKPTAHGRQAFTSSGTFTVPTAVRSINIHCTGGGGGGDAYRARQRGGDGGCGGYTSYKNGISVTPGTKVTVVVGAGGAVENNGGTSSASVNGTTYSAAGGYAGGLDASAGGSGGGGYAYGNKSGSPNGGAGGSNGGDGAKGTAAGGKGQGTTTKEFGTGTLYSGGGGGGAYIYYGASVGAGGSGGGGAGGNNGSAGTGGGGGGGTSYYTGGSTGTGGSGNVIIAW